MQEISIRVLDETNASDINIKNEPFPLFGRLLPRFQDGRWSYSVRENETPEEDIFPDEAYDYEAMKEDCVFLGAYDGAACVGLAVLKHQWNRYIYLHDLKVRRAYRGRHIATEMMDAAYQYAAEHGYRGIWTVAQDNNLAACLFYLHAGFRIGGLDTEVYRGTKQEGKADIFFYRDAAALPPHAGSDPSPA